MPQIRRARPLGRMVAAFVCDALDPLARDWALLTGTSALRLGLGFVASILVARTLGPAQLGILATLATVGTVLGVVVDPGLTTAAVVRIAAARGNAAAVERRIGAFLWLRVGVALVVVGPGLALVYPGSVALFGTSDHAALLALTLLGVAATAASGGMSAVLQATGHVDRLSIVLLSNSAATALLAVVLAAVGWLNLVTVLLVLGLATSVGSWGLSRCLWPEEVRSCRPRGRESGWSRDPVATLPRSDRSATRGWGDLVAEARALFEVGRWLWLSDVLAAMAAQLDVLLVTWWAGPTSAGIYALARNLASKVDVVNHSLYAALLPTAAALRDKAASREYVRRSVARSALVTVAIFAGLPLAGPAIHLVYGPAYDAAAGVLRTLLLVAIVDVWATPVLLLALPARQPRALAVGDAVRLAALLGAGRLLVPGGGASGAALARLASRSLGALAALGLLWQQNRRAARSTHVATERR